MKIASSPTSGQLRRRLLILAVLAAVVCAGAVTPGGWLGTASADPGTAQEPGTYTVFNNPSAAGEADFTIENHLVELIDATPAGEAIHGAKFSWTRTPVAEALARAQERGVEVSLAIDSQGNEGVNADPSNAAMSILRGAGLTELVFCSNAGVGNSACIGNRSDSINHNKLFTFSAADGMSDVVLVSSQNLTNSQNSQYNNLVVVHGDPELYQAFGRHMDNLLAQRKNNNYYTSADGYFRSPVTDARVFFSPRADSNGGTSSQASTDLVAGRLSYITSHEAGCSVDVAHAQFTGPRLPVADELRRIAGLGCQVRIVAGDNMTQYIRDRLVGVPNITVRQLDGMHSKYITYSGNYNGSAGRELVFTGSQNLTGPALRSHDETLIRLELPGVYGDYQENFDLLWSRAS